MNEQKLIFVYNADATIFSMATDFVKKIAAPESYECNLCMITYGSVAMKKEWKEYLESLAEEKVFLHRDEFIEKYPALADKQLPIIYIQERDGDIHTLLSNDEINDVHSINELKQLLTAKLSQNGQ